jgi:hypothetical protein
MNSMWDPPTLDEVIRLLAKRDSSRALEKRAVFLIVDGLHNIRDLFGELRMFQILMQFGGLAHYGFILICATSTISGPIDRIPKGSRRRRLALPCEPMKIPTINGLPAFDIRNNPPLMLVQDCDGHGRAL